MIGFGHLLLDDVKLLIFGGRKSGGDFLDEVWMLDLDTGRWSVSTIKIPQKGKYRAHLIDTDTQSEVHLFQHGHPEKSNQGHFVMAVADLINTMHSVDVLPSVRRLSDLEGSGPNRAAMEAITERLVHEEGLSKNERKKLVQKLKRKMMRQCQRRWSNRWSHGRGLEVMDRKLRRFHEFRKWTRSI